MARNKIAFFDMEGTLLKKDHHLDNGKVAPSAWTVIAAALGEDCLMEEEASKEKWLAGEYDSYLHWMRDSIAIHKKYGLRESVYTELVANSEIMPGAERLTNRLKQDGFHTVVITGGFKALADKVQVALKLDHAMAGCEYFFGSDGELEHWNLLPSDEEGKVDFMELMLSEYKAKAEHCIFVGDGKNDVHLAKTVGVSIAFNAQEELKEVSTYCVEQKTHKEDLSVIIDYLEEIGTLS